MPPAYSKDNEEKILEDISQFQSKHPEGKLATIKIKNLDYFYNLKGPNPTETILGEVVDVFKQIGMEWFAYQRHGQWLVGFYQDDSKERIEQKVSELEIKTSQEPETATFQGNPIQINPFKVSVDIEYTSLEDLFKE